MDKKIHLRIITLAGVVLDDKVDYALLPMKDGGYGILYNHAPLIGALEKGRLKYRIDDKEFFAMVNGGIAQVADNESTIMTESAKKEEMLTNGLTNE